MPKVIGLENGPPSLSKVCQGLTEILRINWKLHCGYHPQRSGHREKINRTLKEILNKLTLETGPN